MVPIAPLRGCARRAEALPSRGREMATIEPLCRWVPSLAAEKFLAEPAGNRGDDMQNVGIFIFIFREGFTENALGVSGMNMQHSHCAHAPPRQRVNMRIPPSVLAKRAAKEEKAASKRSRTEGGWTEVLECEDAYHAHTMAYATCATTDEHGALDKMKNAEGKPQRCENAVRLAKMQCLEVARSLEDLQRQQKEATKVLEDAVSQEISRHTAEMAEIRERMLLIAKKKKEKRKGPSVQAYARLCKRHYEYGPRLKTYCVISAVFEGGGGLGAGGAGGTGGGGGNGGDGGNGGGESMGGGAYSDGDRNCRLVTAQAPSGFAA